MIKKIKLCAKGLYSSSRIYLHQIIIEYVLNLGHTPVLGHLASAQQDVR